MPQNEIEKITFNQLTKQWLQFKKAKIKESTYLNYKFIINTKFTKELGEKTLEELLKYDFNMFIEDLSKKILDRNPERDSIKGERLLTIIENVLALKQKNVIKLLYGIEGENRKTHREIAKIFNVAPPTIFGNEKYAIQNLRKHLMNIIVFKTNLKIFKSLIILLSRHFSYVCFFFLENL